MDKAFLRAEWRNLLMANYIIDPALLQPYLPCGTEIDLFNGNCYVSLVGFLFKDTSLKGFRVPFHHTFEEVNLRFYVRYPSEEGWKRGVVFMKEIVPKRMISLVANTVYGEKYVTLPMRHSWEHKNDGFHVQYEWKLNGQWNYLRALAEPGAEEIAVGSEEEFITEHYWGYTTVNKDCTGVYEVRHPRWKVHRVKEFNSLCDAATLYGPAFAAPLSQKPSSVFLAEGSAITVQPGSRLYFR